MNNNFSFFGRLEISKHKKKEYFYLFLSNIIIINYNINLIFISIKEELMKKIKKVFRIYIFSCVEIIEISYIYI
jgi:hypothetical protein